MGVSVDDVREFTRPPDADDGEDRLPLGQRPDLERSESTLKWRQCLSTRMDDDPEIYEDLLVETEHGTRYRTLEIDESGEGDED